jgi:uncharacterized protein YciI
MTRVFVVDLSYVADLDRIDAHLDDHREFLQRQYDAGLFLASGRKTPRTGGVILARGERSAVEQALAQDPFHVHGLATYSLTEFAPTMTAPGLEMLLAGPELR